jgi:hypothetical protein
MNFEPKTEKEIAESKLMPKGEYDFEVVDAFEKLSKSSGKPMIELRLKLPNGKGGRTITDYLVAETEEKLRHAADACGLLDKYNKGSISNNDFRGKRGRLKLGIEKDKTKTWPDKNVVVDYVIVSRLPEGAGSSPLYFKN